MFESKEEKFVRKKELWYDVKKRMGELEMGYIMDLRKEVGHRPLLMPCGGVLLFNEKGQILMQRRRDNRMWSCPAGSMELGESFEETAVREVLEETGLHCKKLEFFTLESGEKMHYIYPNQDEIYSIEAVYVCREYEGEMKVQEEEIIEQGFFDLDDLPEPIFPLYDRVIKMYREKNG